MIFVSHDRYFVDKLASKLYIFGGGNIEESHQSYSEYLEIEKELRELDTMEEAAKEPQKPKEEKPKSAPKKLSFKEKNEYDTLPKEIEALEEEIKNLKINFNLQKKKMGIFQKILLFILIMMILNLSLWTYVEKLENMIY